MLSILKKEKQERLGFDLCIAKNQSAVIKASLDHKVPLISKGNGVFIVDHKHAKNLEKFLKQFMANSINCHQGIIDRGNPKTDYILIYDIEEVKS